MGSRSCSVQELVFFLFLGAIPRAFRIVPLHFRALFHRELRKMADEADQFPTVVLAAVDAAKGGHAGEAHAVFNNPEKFAVRETLCFQQAQVGWLRIETLANQCVSAAVVGVAGGAMIRKMEARIAQVFSGGGNGILRRARICGERQVARIAGHHGFEMRRRGAGAQAIVEDRCRQKTREAGESDQDYEDESSTFHSHAAILGDRSRLEPAVAFFPLKSELCGRLRRSHPSVVKFVPQVAACRILRRSPWRNKFRKNTSTCWRSRRLAISAR